MFSPVVRCAFNGSHWDVSAPDSKGIYEYPLLLEGISSRKRKDVSRRIARIHGHVHGIAEMVDEGRSYSEIVHQISAVRSSLDSVIQVIIDDLVKAVACLEPEKLSGWTV